jgi:hypothetical protein
VQTVHSLLWPFGKKYRQTIGTSIYALTNQNIFLD